ncbi:MAG: hypothetical protein UR66_C0017G0002 [Candidatus Moranbacteria bacterium GW2011_GWE1_35_17]|nr:MAG: hypothetical protein UR66_C0017G0002 [Candidatus Moranbacteria bacterium GW2011_GWE1_35_17]KKP89558.1 MAG: hypothetical protein UR95_C0007G0094 [Parcubacteria group bacterium GW2011_GWC1_36_108]HCU01673.1 glycosyltransferase [Candidatus Nomurabacteria bacterium]
MSEKKFISVVTPVYKCEKCIDALCARLKSVIEKITDNFEIILVNDASPDNAWDVIMKNSKNDPRIKGINLSRNFGQHYAITAGIDSAEGDWVVVMDCDLQDKPEEISKLYNKAIEGEFDIVFGRRIMRKDGFLKRMASRFFYKVFEYLSGIKFDYTVANFSISKRLVIESFKDLREQNRSFPYFINWLGFNRGYVDIDHGKRDNGESAYTIKKLLKFALDNIIAYSNKPLILSIWVGLFFSFLSIAYVLYLILRYISYGVVIEGWTSVIVSIWFIGGLIFANLGVIGLYIGKIFNETKNRPLYIIKEKIGF